MGASQAAMAAPFFAMGVSLSYAAYAGRQGRLDPLTLLWATFAVVILAFCTEALMGARLGPFQVPVAILGSGGCAFSWLLTRALFRRSRPSERWPWAILAAVIATAAALHLARLVPEPSGVAAIGLRAMANLHLLIASTVIILVFIEVWDGVRPALPKAERRFRIAYTAGYAALFAISMLLLQAWEHGGGDALDDRIKAVCAAIALIGATWAVAYRRAHPLAGSAWTSAKPADDDAALAERIERMFRDEAIHQDPELKVADLALRLGVPEYKVSRAIAGPLGYANFNRLVNRHRIQRAQALLADPDRRRDTVLAIALDSGFASLGPFIRAFKEETGQTPSAYRAARSSGPTASPVA